MRDNNVPFRPAADRLDTTIGVDGRKSECHTWKSVPGAGELDAALANPYWHKPSVRR